MNKEHDEIIEAMTSAVYKSEHEPMYRRNVIHDALRAAAERGYRLAKIPKRHIPSNSYLCMSHEQWNACLDAIEVIDLNDEVVTP